MQKQKSAKGYCCLSQCLYLKLSRAQLRHEAGSARGREKTLTQLAIVLAAVACHGEVMLQLRLVSLEPEGLQILITHLRIPWHCSENRQGSTDESFT